MPNAHEMGGKKIPLLGYFLNLFFYKFCSVKNEQYILMFFNAIAYIIRILSLNNEADILRLLTYNPTK